MNGTISLTGNVLQDVVDADDQIVVPTAEFLPHEAPSHGLARALSFPLRRTIQPQFGPQLSLISVVGGLARSNTSTGI